MTNPSAERSWLVQMEKSICKIIDLFEGTQCIQKYLGLYEMRNEILGTINLLFGAMSAEIIKFFRLIHSVYVSLSGKIVDQTRKWDRQSKFRVLI